MNPRYDPCALRSATAALFTAAGLSRPIAAAVAEILVDADLMGYDTHGLQFVPAYLAAVEAGRLAREGAPTVVHDSGAALLLDAGRLPGQWATLQALALARTRLAEHPVVTVTMRRSGNISCLATYVKRAAEAGCVALLMASAPGNAAVAPHGGRRAMLSTNPIAFAVPGEPHPLIADIGTASTTNRAVERAMRQGEPLDGPWLIDGEGAASADPAVLGGEPPGAILPLGGRALGHKGFALALLVEALTSGLAGAGRSGDPEAERGGNNVFLLLLDPRRFAGLAALRGEIAHLAASCAETPAIDEGMRVRLPGARACTLYDEQRREGVRLHPEIMPRLLPCLERYGIEAPQPLGGEVAGPSNSPR